MPFKRTYQSIIITQDRVIRILRIKLCSAFLLYHGGEVLQVEKNFVAAGAKETTTGVGFAGYTYMQDITKSKCDSIVSGTEGRLIDKRDNKVYWVAKLKDGLCWMTQNLDYDGGAAAGYGGGDVATLELGTSFTTNTQSQKLYYDPGDYVYTLAPEVSECAAQNLDTGLGGCVKKGWRNMEGMIPSSDPNYSDVLDAIDETTYLYNAHYLIGNYYNWMAATIGTGSSITTDGDNANKSICPTGWSLPMGGNVSMTGYFGGLTSGLSKGANITVAPYYFVYGGYISSSSLTSAGRDGWYWPSTAKDTNNAYYWYFSSSSIVLYNSINRYYGLSVRCVAR